MRVAILVYCLEGGGVQRQTLTLAGAFAAQGIAVDYVVVRATGELRDRIPPGVSLVTLLPQHAWSKYTSFNALDQLRALSPLVRYLRQARPTALLSGGTHINALSVIAHAVSGIGARLVLRVTNHMSRGRGKAVGSRRLSARIASVLYRRADCVVCVSDEVRRDLLQVTSLDAGQVTVIREPVITPAIRDLAAEDPKHPWLRPGGPPVILGAGRLSLQKDFETLVRAFALVRQSRDARLIIIGSHADRDYVARLRACIVSNSVGDSVDLVGYAMNPYAFMARPQVFVLSSLWEGCPNVLAEAIYCGCTVVAADCPGGVREVMESGPYGLLVPTRDPPTMAAAILTALAATPVFKPFEHCPAGFDAESSVRGYLGALAGT